MYQMLKMIDSQVINDVMADRMSKLKREINYLERWMQRSRMKIAKLQQDPTQTPVISRIGSTQK